MGEKVESLLHRLTEATAQKIALPPVPANLSLKSGSTTLRRTTELAKKSVDVEQEGVQKTSAPIEDNDLIIIGGMGDYHGVKVIFVRLTKSKPFKPLVIARPNIRKIAETIGGILYQASKSAHSKNFQYEAVMVEAQFSAGKETRRLRACVAQAAAFNGGKITEKLETDGQQLYVLGPR